jgi:proteasome lid subunit RPN8/RPN11
MIQITKKKSSVPLLIAACEDEQYAQFMDRSNYGFSSESFQVFISEQAWVTFLAHGQNVYKESKHEAQGIFVGKFFKDEMGEFVVATEYMPGFGESRHAYVGMSEECLIKISDHCRNNDLLMLIWIHTHPNFGVFYSNTDMTCIKNNFYMPFHSGIVVDIIRKLTKGYKVRDGIVDEFENYFIYNKSGNTIYKPYQNRETTQALVVKKTVAPKNPEMINHQLTVELDLVKTNLADLKLLAMRIIGLLQVPELGPSLGYQSFFNERFEQLKALLDSQPVQDVISQGTVTGSDNNYNDEIGQFKKDLAYQTELSLELKSLLTSIKSMADKASADLNVLSEARKGDHSALLEIKEVLSVSPDSDEGLARVLEEQLKIKKYLLFILFGVPGVFIVGAYLFLHILFHFYN